jgi:hypothetical protein
MLKAVALSCLALLLFSGLIEGAKPRPILDTGHIEKKAILEKCIYGRVRKIQIGDFDRASGKEIAILGQKGYWLLSCDDYHVMRSYELTGQFKDTKGRPVWLGLNPELVDVSGNGLFEIMKGGGGFGDVGLLNAKGKLLWTFHPDPKLHPNKMIHGDLNRDGHIEFYVADHTGLYQLDPEGVVTKKISNERIIDIQAIEGDQLRKPVLAALTYAGEFLIFDYQGSLLKKLTPGLDIRRFDVVNWHGKGNLLVGEQGFFMWRLSILDLNGNILFTKKLRYPHWVKWVSNPKGIAVAFNKDKAPYLAVLANTKASVGLSQLNIFSPQGELIYQDILRYSNGICVNDSVKDQREVLLVGDNGTAVWEYSLK